MSPSKRTKTVATRSMPRLSPGTDAIQVLETMPLAKLRAAAEARGIAVPSRSTRAVIARDLVRDATRAQSDRDYRESGAAFDSRETAYPHIRRLVVKHRIRRVLDIGCGPGLFAEELRRSKALPRDGSYLGFDLAPTAVDIASKRFAEDHRFTFKVGDAERVQDFTGYEIDGIVISFVLSYLDTHAVHALVAGLAKAYRRAPIIVALTFLSSVDALPDAPASDEQQLAAARRFLAGDHAIAAERWDVRRFSYYRNSLETFYDIEQEHVLKTDAQLLWVAAPRSKAR